MGGALPQVEQGLRVSDREQRGDDLHGDESVDAATAGSRSPIWAAEPTEIGIKALGSCFLNSL
jgi:hypothetical protein